MSAGGSLADRWRGKLGDALRNSRPLRFVLVGGFNTGLCYLVYATLIWANLPFWLAHLGAVSSGFVLRFTTQGRIVFGSSDPRRFARFVASWAVVYAARTATIGVLMQFGMSPLVAGLIVLPAAAAASYFIQKSLVFRRPASEARS